VLGEPVDLPADWEENLFRIGQECLTNVLRHAHASRVTASIGYTPEEVCLEFADDGRGFDPGARSEGFGLLGMRERVDAMGGQITVQSSSDRGTKISIRLPLFPAFGTN
jgi:signal transduction histidine kinase